MGLIGIILIAIVTANSVVCIIEWCGGLIKEIINKDKKTNEAEDRVEELSRTFEIERSLNGILNNQRAEINRLKQQISNNSEQDEHMENNDKQIVYKIEKGDLIGDIKGNNITVILMKGDINGDVNSKEGDVVLIKGDINGDVEANKVICPRDKSEYENYIDKLSNVEKLSKNSEQPKEKPKKESKCPTCYWYNSERDICESPNDNGETCGYTNKEAIEQATKDLANQPIVKYVNCRDCGYAKLKAHLALSGIDTSNSYDCTKFNKLVRGDYCVCDKFVKKICETCHYGLYNTDGEIECYKNGYCEYTPNKEDEAHCLCAKPNTNCAKCAWYDYVEQECKSWDANEGECQFIDKYESKDKIKDSFRQLPPDYVKCADCVYAENYNLKMYKCTKYNGVVVKDSVRICDSFKQKERHICKSCYYFVKSINESYCSKHNLDKLYDSIVYCSLYDGTGETTNYK